MLVLMALTQSPELRSELHFLLHAAAQCVRWAQFSVLYLADELAD